MHLEKQIDDLSSPRNPLQVAVEKIMSREIGLGVKESCRGTSSNKRGMLSTDMK